MERLSKIVISSLILIIQVLYLNGQDSEFKRHVSITTDKGRIDASITNEKVKAPENNKLYHWFRNDKIFSNYGGYSGDLLHGIYVEYNDNWKLICKGRFNRGLKTGIWKYWHTNGEIKEIIIWNNGTLHGERILFSEEGKRIFRGKYVQGRLHGKVHMVESDSLIVEKYWFGRNKSKEND